MRAGKSSRFPRAQPAYGWSPRPRQCWPVPVPVGKCAPYQQLVAARRLAQTPDDGPLLDVLPKMVNLIKIVAAPDDA